MSEWAKKEDVTKRGWVTILDEEDVWKIVCTPQGVWEPPKYTLVHHCPAKGPNWSALHPFMVEKCNDCDTAPSDKMKMLWELADKYEEPNVCEWYHMWGRWRNLANMPNQVAKITGLTAYHYGRDEDE